jgi:hypothetical protein
VRAGDEKSVKIGVAKRISRFFLGERGLRVRVTGAHQMCGRCRGHKGLGVKHSARGDPGRRVLVALARSAPAWWGVLENKKSPRRLARRGL